MGICSISADTYVIVHYRLHGMWTIQLTLITHVKPGYTDCTHSSQVNPAALTLWPLWATRRGTDRRWWDDNESPPTGPPPHTPSGSDQPPVKQAHYNYIAVSHASVLTISTPTLSEIHLIDKKATRLWYSSTVRYWNRTISTRVIGNQIYPVGGKKLIIAHVFSSKSKDLGLRAIVT